MVFGRPKGDRGSYKYWEEDDVPITVAFEVLEGDCVTKPITKARIAFAGTWHPYRAHS